MARVPPDARVDALHSAARPDIRTPVTLLTGFLGSGKTTLLNRALNDPTMSRTAVVINEFGEIGIDHALTTASNDTIMVLENGCLCCTVFGDLVQTLNRLYHAREAGEIGFDRVVIETSGLAEPSPILQAFLSEPTLEGLYRVGAVITTVDAINAEATLREHPASVHQVALADYVLITKFDLIDPQITLSHKNRLISSLRKMNSTGAILAIDEPGVNPVRLLTQSSADPLQDVTAARQWIKSLEGSSASEHCDHPHAEESHPSEHVHDSAVASFNLIRETPISREALELLLASLEKHLGPSLLRVKGLINVEAETRPAVIQGAQHLLHNLTWLPAWPDADRRTRIVFITYGVSPEELGEMISLLDRVAQRTSAARRRASEKSGASPKKL